MKEVYGNANNFPSQKNKKQKKTCEGGQSANTGPARKPIKFDQIASDWVEVRRLPEGLLVLAKCKSWYNDHDFISIAK